MKKKSHCACDRTHRHFNCPICNKFHITCLYYLDEYYYSHCEECRPIIWHSWRKQQKGYQFTIFDYIT